MNGKTLLLVEDSADDEALVLRALRRHHVDARVLVAHDGVEALEHLFGPQAATHPVPDLVLLDLKMPRVDGFQVLERLRAEPRTHEIPVVVFSSSNEPGDVRRSYDLGASSFVRKPVEFDEFSNAVRLLGEYWLGLNLGPLLAHGSREATRAPA
jgi:CheY-like chemotaxis protein